jgi:hypothetical protein
MLVPAVRTPTAAADWVKKSRRVGSDMMDSPCAREKGTVQRRIVTRGTEEDQRLFAESPENDLVSPRFIVSPETINRGETIITF